MDNPWCWACGRDERQRPDGYYAPWRLERAHLSSGSGKLRRVCDRRYVCLLCARCHLLHGKHRIRVGKRLLPFIHDCNMLWWKRLRDPGWYEPEAIAALWTGIPPEPSPPDQFFLDEYSARRGS